MLSLNNIILGLLIAELIGYLTIFKFKQKKVKTPLYYIKVTLNHGSKVKLVLNEEQYTNFRTWLNKDTDLYELRQGDEYYMAINRIYLSAVEVRKR